MGPRSFDNVARQHQRIVLNTVVGMKILTCNAGYLLGYQNVLWGYVPPPVGSVLGDSETERQKLAQLVSVIDSEQPDVVSLLEVDQGSHRTATAGQYRTLINSLHERELPYEGTVANKYGTGIVSSLPFFGSLGNAMLSRRDRPMRTHYLTAGRKRLVIETALTEDLVLFTVHLSLSAKTRKRQFTELTALIRRRASGRDVIVTGDFNTFDGVGTLEQFAEQTELTTWRPGETVPLRPLDDLLGNARTLDLFLCSPNVEITRCDVLDVQLSDHRPVVLELAPS